MSYSLNPAFSRHPLPAPLAIRSGPDASVTGCAPVRRVSLSDAEDRPGPVSLGRLPLARFLPDAASLPPWFERDMPGPVEEMDKVLPDPETWETLQNPVQGETFYRQQIARRAEMEARGEEYIFAPLQVTLENMWRLTAHILAGRQFPEPLTEEDVDAFLKLQRQIEDLIAHKAPYRRTVQLAFVMTVLQELMVERHVIGPLQEAKPRLFDRQRCMRAGFLCQSDSGETGTRVAATIPLQEVLACRFGDLVLDGGEGDKDSLLNFRGMATELLRYLDNPAVLLYPSFAPLDPEHFCRAGHLPVYPLGLMTAHAINADGFMRTPLAFLEHDMLHTVINETWRYLEHRGPLKGGPGSRLAFRQLALDRLPAGLREHNIERAVILVLFTLFHERDVINAQCVMEFRTPLWLWRIICEARRENRYDYGPDYWAIGDSQALLACLWVFRVYQCLNPSGDAGFVSAEVQASQAMASGLAALLEHWAFFERHSDRLHGLLLPRCRQSRIESQYLYPVRGPMASAFPSREVVLQLQKDPDAEGLVRHTDLVYFVTLLSEGGPECMARILGEAPPDVEQIRFLFET